MKYRLTCLTPVLVGDGGHLSPIDYMVWKDQVNVLDQNRIFKLLAKGPRLDSYLKQIVRADKLDFASWGGFAQNFADRRVPFEHSSSTGYWEALGSEHLRIPTFQSSPQGPFVPGSALKGALRTALLSGLVTDGALRNLAARLSKDRPPRNLGELLEDRLLGSGATSRVKPFALGDSAPVNRETMRIFLLRVAYLAPQGPRLVLRWKRAPRGTAEGRRPHDGTPTFAEMASPGTVFQGRWRVNPFYRRPEVVKALRWKSVLTSEELLEAANRSAERMLASQKRYAEVAELNLVGQSVLELEQRLAQARLTKRACLVNLGWGGGFLTKSGGPPASEPSYREILGQLSYYSKAIASGLPFPKTRRIVFLGDQPATLPGWALLELS